LLAKNQHRGPDFVLTRYAVDPADVSKFFMGSPVSLTGAAFENGVPVVTLANPGDALIGVVVGWDYIPVREGVDYVQGAAYLHIIDDPDAVFVATSSTPLAVNDIGMNINLTAQAVQNGRFSDVQLDAATVGSAATNQLRVLRKVPAHWADMKDVDGNIELTHYEVKINRHQLRAGVAGV
jgi:hypothetical protein